MSEVDLRKLKSACLNVADLPDDLEISQDNEAAFYMLGFLEGALDLVKNTVMDDHA